MQYLAWAVGVGKESKSNIRLFKVNIQTDKCVHFFAIVNKEFL